VEAVNRVENLSEHSCNKNESLNDVVVGHFRVCWVRLEAQDSRTCEMEREDDDDLRYGLPENLFAHADRE
jgi:hypothetical protein